MNHLEGIKRLLKYISKRKKSLLILLIMAVVVSILELAPPQLVGKLVDILPEGQVDRAIFYIVIFGVVYVLSSVIKLVYGNLVMSFNYSIIEDVRKNLFSAILAKEYYVTDKEMAGDVIARATGDIEQITRVVAGPLNGFIGRIMTFLFSLVLLGCIDPVLVLISIGVSSALFFMSKNISVKNKNNGKKERGIIGAISQKLSDVIKNLVLIKSYQTEKNELDELRNQSRELMKCRNHLLRQMTKYWSGVEICNGTGFVLAFVTAAFAVASGKISGGQIVVIYSYLQSSFSSMVSVSRYKTDIYNADAAMVRLFAMIPETQAENSLTSYVNNDTNINEGGVHRVDVKNLSVHISDRDVVSNVSFSLEKGKMTVLIGESGAGKTSVINALLGFVENYSGQIFIDSQDCTDKPGLRRKLIRTSFQNAYLFQKSLEQNIYYGSEKGSRMSLSSEIDISGIKQAHGAEAALDAKNGGLSGGEQRKIALIRTVNKDVPIYIFDEPTAEMDLKSGKQIINVLRKLSKEAIILVVSHDDELIRAADKVISVGKQGRPNSFE